MGIEGFHLAEHGGEDPRGKAFLHGPEDLPVRGAARHEPRFDIAAEGGKPGPVKRQPLAAPEPGSPPGHGEQAGGQGQGETGGRHAVIAGDDFVHGAGGETTAREMPVDCGDTEGDRPRGGGTGAFGRAGGFEAGDLGPQPGDGLASCVPCGGRGCHGDGVLLHGDPGMVILAW